MTSQFDFSNDEWTLVATSPLMVGMAVAKAEDSGFFGTIAENRTMLSRIAVDPEGNPARLLIDQVAATDTRAAYESLKGRPADGLAHDAVAVCRALVPLLERVATPDEVTGFAQWLVDIAEAVAVAAKESGVRVSPREEAVVDQVAAALGTDRRQSRG